MESVTLIHCYVILRVWLKALVLLFTVALVVVADVWFIDFYRFSSLMYIAVGSAVSLETIDYRITKPHTTHAACTVSD